MTQKPLIKVIICSLILFSNFSYFLSSFQSQLFHLLSSWWQFSKIFLQIAFQQLLQAMTGRYHRFMLQFLLLTLLPVILLFFIEFKLGPLYPHIGFKGSARNLICLFCAPNKIFHQKTQHRLPQEQLDFLLEGQHPSHTALSMFLASFCLDLSNFDNDFLDASRECS